MSILEFAILNGGAAIALLAALGYVCSLPFRLADRRPRNRVGALAPRNIVARAS